MALSAAKMDREFQRFVVTGDGDTAVRTALYGYDDGAAAFIKLAVDSDGRAEVTLV
mgnify:CR=1 FL=1